MRAIDCKHIRCALVVHALHTHTRRYMFTLNASNQSVIGSISMRHSSSYAHRFLSSVNIFMITDDLAATNESQQLRLSEIVVMNKNAFVAQSYRRVRCGVVRPWSNASQLYTC